MPVILKPHVYNQWLDPGNQNAVELVALLQNEIISELVCFPLEKQTGATGHIDPSRAEAAGTARQTSFDWPEPGQPARTEWIKQPDDN